MSDLIPDLDANALWAQARKMPHNYIPDYERDADYLRLVHQAASIGLEEALAKLGEYAMRRQCLVEAYFWLAQAKVHGLKQAESLLRTVKMLWLKQGCPSEYENAHPGFSEMQGSLGRALLRIRCAMNAPLARARIRELAAAGCEEARLFSAV